MPEAIHRAPGLYDLLLKSVNAAAKMPGRSKPAMPSRCGAVLAAHGKLWYGPHMSTFADPKAPRTMMVPVMTMEEVPVLSEAERAELVASLKAAEARIAAGEYTIYDPATFKDRLIAVYRAARAAKVT